MRAISIDRHSRTVIDATTSSRASFSFTRLRRMSRRSSAIGSSPGVPTIVAPSMCGSQDMKRPPPRSGGGDGKGHGRMTYNVAFLDVIDANMQSEIRSQPPPDFAIQFGETADRADHMRLIADADFILTAVAVDADMIRAA